MLETFKKQFEKAGFKEPTAIQKAVYPEMVESNHDIVGIAPTGSGKTIAYTMPLLKTATPGNGIGSLVVEPSQELAIQVTNVMREWAKPFGLKVLPLIGGANPKRQREQLKKQPDIVVGTPGRIVNLINENRLKTNKVKKIVVDEADDLLADSTFDQVKEIVARCPRDASVAYFSATVSSELYHLEETMGKAARVIDVSSIDKTRGEVKHTDFQVSRGKRNEALRRFAKLPNFKALVFFNQTNTLEHAYHFLKNESGVSVADLTAKGNKQKRQKALSDFRLGRTKLLLTTDVAARGLDIKKLPVVINYDLPDEASEYVHRVGRTGRMGEPGMVINFGNDHDFRGLKQQVKPLGYQLKPVYYYDGQLVFTKPEAGEKKPKTDKLAAKRESERPASKKNKHKKRKQKNKGKPQNHKKRK